ncbi:MAG: DnaJ domain-containing protein [Acidobacteria bacterium]|nr:DnaJ domain-containing protein [Acidobacteriota bacterium]
MRVNYYEVLGVERTATEDEIRDHFRKLAREHHPDRYRGTDKAEAERKFQVLTEAMNVLTNPQRRKAHDSELSGGAGARAMSDPKELAKVYLSNGVKAFKSGDVPAAIEAFDMAVKHNPDDPRAHHYLALAAAKVPSMLRQAVQAVETAVQKEPYNPLFLKDAGTLCRRVGLFSKAERYFEEALKWDQGNAEIETALAEIRQARAKK